MPGRSQVHAWSPEEIERLSQVPVPAKIKCGRCHKNVIHTRFSTKQLTDLRYHLKTTGKMCAINCKPCTGQPMVEVECVMCRKTKGLEEFAKSQRAKPDSAKCFKCTEDQVNTQPVNTEYDAARAFRTPDSSNGNVPEYWSSASTTEGSSADDSEWASVRGDTSNERSDNSSGGVALSNTFRHTMRITGSVDENLIDSEYAQSTTGSAQNVGGRNGSGIAESQVNSSSWHTKSTGPRSANSGFDPRRYGHPSTTSNTGTARSFTSSVAERSFVSEIRPNGWAKIKAYKPEGPLSGGPSTCRPAGDTASDVEENAWQSDEESDGGGDSDDDDSDGDNIVI